MNWPVGELIIRKRREARCERFTPNLDAGRPPDLPTYA